MYSICTAKIKPISCIYYLLSKPTSSINSSFVAAKRLFLISKSAVLSLISWPNLAFGLYLSNFSAKGYPPISKIRSKALSIKSCAPELTRLATLDASRATKVKVIKGTWVSNCGLNRACQRVLTTLLENNLPTQRLLGYQSQLIQRGVSKPFPKPVRFLDVVEIQGKYNHEAFVFWIQIETLSVIS